MSMLGIGAVSYHYQGANSQLYVAGFVAAIFHLINHATFKGALFMITGGIDHSTGTRDVKNWAVYLQLCLSHSRLQLLQH